MNNQKIDITKLCSFYVSDWHIVTMLLPYINNKINENIQILPIFEKGIANNIEILVNKLNLKNKEKILNINWKEVNGIKYTNVNNLIKKYKQDELIIIVKGSKNYIEMVNKNIMKSLKKKENSLKVKIVNCYEVIEFNNNIQEILDEHDKILNTSGEREIQEIFEGYKNIKKQNK